MKKLIILLLICFLQIQYLEADSVQNIDGGNCTTEINDRGKQAFMTFYGDSLGDFVDSWTHGIVGWDAYLGFFRPDIDWRIQNFAVQGWTTKSVYDALIKCLVKKDIRKNFITSNNVAFEIGGNDMVNYTPSLIFFPWRYRTYHDPLTNKDVKGFVDVVLHNIKVLIYFFRHPLWDKNVLVMGNFPTFSYSPTLGHMGDYFDIAKDINVYYDKWNEIDPAFRALNVQKDDMSEFLKSTQELFIDVFPNVINPLYTPIKVLGESFFDDEFLKYPLKVITEKLFDQIPNYPSQEEIDKQIEDSLVNTSKAQEWYFEWIYMNSKSPLTAASIGLLLMQPDLEGLANEMREKTRNWRPPIKDGDKIIYTPNNRTGGNYVQFLNLYPLFIRTKDCTDYGQCWVANPFLYRDFLPGHVNQFGYYVWAKALSDKMATLQNDGDWNRDAVLNFGGTTDPNAPDKPIVPIDENGDEVTMEEPEPPSAIDWLLLMCFLFGSCHF